jgi:endonuclease YncB( thermonuclease family)
MKTIRKTASVFTAIFLSAFFAVAQQAPAPAPQPAAAPGNNIQLVIEGKVINVHDGDTVTVLDQYGKKFHIRLQGIDAPELKQEFGTVSQQNLARLVVGKQVSIFWTKVDKYRRTVGTIKIDGRDINIEQVKAGLAWHFKKYQDEQEPADRITYAAAEQQARAAKLGLWQDPSPTVPGDWRQAVKAKRWGPPPPAGTIVGNSNSKRYHRPDCAGYRDMAEKNRVFFTTVAEAEAAGYKRAGNCPAEVQAAAPSILSPVSPVAATVSTSPAAPAVVPSVVAQPVTIDAAPVPSSSSADSLPVPSPTAPTPTIQADQVLVPSNGQGSDVSDRKIIGNKNSKVYHLPGCSSYNRVSEKNQVRFQSAAEAEKAGYRLAGNCKSPKE